MDELDLLKKDWKKQTGSFPELSYNEIYELIHKKSSSLVKWIFIIGIAEFFFWAVLNLLIPDSYLDIYEKFNLKLFLNVSQAIHYILILVFVYLFYKNYKAISVIESTKLLMRKILKARKTVNYYVYFSISLYILTSIIVYLIMFSQPDILTEVMNSENINTKYEYFIITIVIIQIVVFVIMCGLLWLYYRVLYGILLRKLYKNYKELANLEK